MEKRRQPLCLDEAHNMKNNGILLQQPPMPILSDLFVQHPMQPYCIDRPISPYSFGSTGLLNNYPYNQFVDTPPQSGAYLPFNTAYRAPIPSKQDNDELYPPFNTAYRVPIPSKQDNNELYRLIHEYIKNLNRIENGDTDEDINNMYGNNPKRLSFTTPASRIERDFVYGSGGPMSSMHDGLDLNPRTTKVLVKLPNGETITKEMVIPESRASHSHELLSSRGMSRSGDSSDPSTEEIMNENITEIDPAIRIEIEDDKSNSQQSSIRRQNSNVQSGVFQSGPTNANRQSGIQQSGGKQDAYDNNMENWFPKFDFISGNDSPVKSFEPFIRLPGSLEHQLKSYRDQLLFQNQFYEAMKRRKNDQNGITQIGFENENMQHHNDESIEPEQTENVNTRAQLDINQLGLSNINHQL